MKIKFRTTVIVFTLISALLLGVSGCHTTEGLEQDHEKGDQAIQKSASDNKTSHPLVRLLPAAQIINIIRS